MTNFLKDLIQVCAYFSFGFVLFVSISSSSLYIWLISHVSFIWVANIFPNMSFICVLTLRLLLVAALAAGVCVFWLFYHAEVHVTDLWLTTMQEWNHSPSLGIWPSGFAARGCQSSCWYPLFVDFTHGKPSVSELLYSLHTNCYHFALPHLYIPWQNLLLFRFWFCLLT